MNSAQPLSNRVGLVVSQVILESKGAVVQLGPEDPIFGAGPLDQKDQAHLVLRLQGEFDVTLDVGAHDCHAVRSVAAITALVAARLRDQR